MGLVYRAQQESPSREVALKIVAPYSLRAEEARQRFLVEVEAMATIEHPSVLPLYQSGEDDFGRPWLTMQLVRGGSLADNLTQYFGHWRKSVALMTTLCEAIAYAHEHGILHRDLKPANILFDEKENPYIADFGLAKWAEEDGGISQTSYLLGSPAYLAPEAAEGGSKLTTTSSDVYGLGAILYELLTGHRPYEGESANEVLTKIISGSPPPPRRIADKIPRDLEVVVLKAMSREPATRYHSAKAFREDLQRWLDGRPILARPISTPEQIWLWAKRNPALAILSLLLLASLAIGSTLLSIKNRELTHALDDAEQRVDFMVRDLPAQVAPLGRLEVLDSVFEDVAKHYQNPARTDPANLARHADFQTQWAQILRPRALTDESLAHLQKAHQLAKQACIESRPPLPLPIVRARASAGWRLGEVLIEDQNFSKAEKILFETNTFLKKEQGRFPNDLQLSHLEAGLSLEIVILYTKTSQTKPALQLITKTEQLWQDFEALLDAAPSNAQTQSFKVEVARVPFFINLVHLEFENTNEREEAISDYIKKTADLIEEDPGNLTFVSEHFTAQLVRGRFYLEEKRGDPIQITNDLRTSDQRSQQIYAQDPGNLKWGSNSVFIAVILARLAKERGDAAASEQWIGRASERLYRLQDIRTTEIDSLTVRSNAHLFCFDAGASRGWSWQRPHFAEAIRLGVAVARQTGQVEDFHQLRRLIRFFTKFIIKNEGEQAAILWLQEFNTTITNERQAQATNPERVAWWHLLQSFTWRQLARLGTNEAEAQANQHLLQAITQAEELLSYRKLEPPNRLELLHHLIIASGDRTHGQTDTNDAHLSRIILASLSKLTPEERSETYKIIKAAHQQSDGSFRKQYQALRNPTTKEQQ